MRRGRFDFIGLLALVTLSACSSPQFSRIDSERGLYESWPLEIRQAILDGKAETGMTPDMVRMSLGKPTEVVTRSGTAQNGEDEIWIYRKGGEEEFDPGMANASMPSGGVMVGPGSGIGVRGPGVMINGPGPIMGPAVVMGPVTGMGPSPFPATSRGPVEEREVVFRNGVVYRADPPPEK